jgi:hypothetical protein
MRTTAEPSRVLSELNEDRAGRGHVANARSEHRSTAYEALDLADRDPDRMAHADASELSFAREPVHGARSYPEHFGSLPNGQQAPKKPVRSKNLQLICSFSLHFGRIWPSNALRLRQ